MKYLSIAGLFFMGSFISTHAQTVRLSDDFNGNSINSSLWNVSLPFGGSSATESGGNLTIMDRATVYSKQGFNTPYQISGIYQTTSPGTTNEQEQFDVYFESNFSLFAPLASYAVPTGVMVDFNTLNPSIQQFDSNDTADSIILAETTTPLPDGIPYNFDITVNGSLVNVYVNNDLLLSAESTLATGNQVGFEDGIFAGDSTSINSIQVSTIPEPGTYGLFFGIVGLLGAMKFRKLTS